MMHIERIILYLKPIHFVKNSEANIFSVQTLSDVKRPGVAVELQKLVGEWPLDVIKHQKKENRKVFSFPISYFLLLFLLISS